jgi:predicted PolB exonuclease-like 3'-5' exonuclease
MNLLTFKLKTIPDIDGCRKLYDLHGLSDDDVAKAVFHKRRQEASTELLRHHLHKVIAVSAVLRTGDQFKVWSLGTVESNEEDLLQRFYSGLARYTPKLVSWGGIAFDLPVIHYRSLLYPVNADQYWAAGQSDNSFQHDNHPSRYHDRHTDLMGLLSGFQAIASAPLNEIATLCGFPGHVVDMEGISTNQQIWDSYQADGIKEIRDAGETEVLNTYLVYLNLQRNRGMIDQAQYETECRMVRDNLIASEQSHLISFEKAWLDQ